MKASPITISIEVTGADEAIEKMNRIKELLSEVNSQIDSLSDIKLEIKVKSNTNKTINQMRKECGLEPIKEDYTIRRHLMKNGKRLTLKQKEILQTVGLNPSNWLAVKNLPDKLMLVHREKGTVTEIPLFEGEALL